ncbi:MAG: hypothetical protein RI955_1004 [Bacteroidota bacterium]|jgi:hypothetical protein
MKRYLLIILFTFPLFSFAQKSKNFFEGGLLLGFNASQVDGDRLDGFHKIGLNAGAFGGFPIFRKNLFIQFELLYSQKGSRMTSNQIFNNSNPNANYVLTLNYAEIPILISYHDKDAKTRLSAGISVSRLFSVNEEINHEATPGAIDYFKKRDICWLGDISFMATKHIGFGMRYSYSIVYIRNFADYTYNGTGNPLNPYFGTNQFNKYVSVRGIYLF